MPNHAVPEVQLRFYEELNDFLAPGLRKTRFSHPLSRRTSVKDLIESFGVPHTEVEVILVNGESVDFSYIVQGADRISVYPMFESLDITPLLRLRPAPLRTPAFVLDTNLGRLARYLRLLGFDCLYRNDYSDAQVASIAADTDRTVLTRDRALLQRRIITRGYFVRAARPRQQVREVLARFDLYRLVTPFSRCVRCNGSLQDIDKSVIQDRLEPKTRKYYEKFRVELKRSGNKFQFKSPKTRRPFRGGSLSFQIPESFNIDISTSGGDLEVRKIDGQVELSTSGGDVEVTEVTGEVEISTSGGDITLQNVSGTTEATTSGGDINVTHCGPALAVITSGGDIDFTHVTGSVTSATSGGDIMLRDLDGEAELATSGGDIEISDVKGGKSVEAATSGGDIVAYNVIADVSLATSSGDIEMEAVKGSVDAASSNGDITGNDIVGEDIEAATSSGDVNLENVLGEMDIASSHGDVTIKMKKSNEFFDIELATSNGDIVCMLPKNYKGSVHATIWDWNKRSSNDIVSDFPLTLSTEDRHKRVATGDINGGGPSINIETSHGDINIKKY